MKYGWKKSEKIHYYSEFLGMKDTITEEDMLIDVIKTEIEKRLTKSERENEILQERLKINIEDEIINFVICLASKMEKSTSDKRANRRRIAKTKKENS